LSFSDTIDANTSPSNIYGFTTLIGIGIGSYLAAGFSVVQAMVPFEDINNAVGFMSIGQALGGIALLGAAGSIFQNVGVRDLAPILPNATPAEVQSILAGSGSALFQSLGGDLKQAVVVQITNAIRDTFVVNIGAAALGLISSFFLSVSILVIQFEHCNG
jgi:hypothetical protein